MGRCAQYAAIAPFALAKVLFFFAFIVSSRRHPSSLCLFRSFCFSPSLSCTPIPEQLQIIISQSNGFFCVQVLSFPRWRIVPLRPEQYHISFDNKYVFTSSQMYHTFLYYYFFRNTFFFLFSFSLLLIASGCGCVYLFLCT